MSSPQVPPGWRHAEGDPAGTERYWNGTRWEGEPRTAGGTAQPPNDPFAAAARPAPQPVTASTPASQSPIQFSANDAKGFLSRLFDLSFETFITTSIIKVLYILFIVFAGLAAIGFILAGFATDAATGIVFLVLSPLLFLLYVILARIWLEIVIVLFRIHDQTAETARNTRK